MRRMLDPKEAGGSLPSTIKFDTEGNRTVGKNLGVDGKLTLKSLVSATNPDGDITKELGKGGGVLYEYNAIFLDNANLGIFGNAVFYSSADTGKSNKSMTTRELYDELLPAGAQYMLYLPVVGFCKITEGENTTYYPLLQIVFAGSEINLYYFDPAKGRVKHPHNFRYDTTTKWNVIRNVASPRQAN